MKKVVEYKMIEGSSPASLAGKVDDMLKEGWHLYHGPISCVTANGNQALAQALVKYEPKKKCSGHKE